MKKKSVVPNPLSALWAAGFFLLLAAGCSHTHYVFEGRQPVADLQDRQPGPVPDSDEFDFVENGVSSSVRYPIVNALDPRRVTRSEDVNSLDHVPSSSWYTPRLGYKEIKSSELVKGPEKTGPPQKPFKIVKAKKRGSDPGFLIRDARGKAYLIKFDSPEFPNLQSTANFVANRLFWGFGYNVPEDYIFRFKQGDFEMALESQEQEDAVNLVLWTAVPEADESFRTTASLFVEGTSLGPVAQRGTRSGDANDLIPHENRRVLRALKVFSMWTNQSGIRPDNMLDVYRGEEGTGHTLHYLLDFGEAFGVHGYAKARMWDGFEYFFSWEETGLNFLTLGLYKKPWEKIELKPSDPRAYFEAEQFEPENWKTVYQFQPILNSQPDDDYWAAKVLGALREEHLQALFKAVNSSDKDYSEFLRMTLMKRREKILRHYLYKVSPLESPGVEEGGLLIEDMGRKLLGDTGNIAYNVKIFNRKNRLLKENSFSSEKPQFSVPIPGTLMSKAGDYLRVDVHVIRDGKAVPRPAEFHVRKTAGSAELVGIVH